MVRAGGDARVDPTVAIATKAVNDADSTRPGSATRGPAGWAIQPCHRLGVESRPDPSPSTVAPLDRMPQPGDLIDAFSPQPGRCWGGRRCISAGPADLIRIGMTPSPPPQDGPGLHPVQGDEVAGPTPSRSFRGLGREQSASTFSLVNGMPRPATPAPASSPSPTAAGRSSTATSCKPRTVTRRPPGRAAGSRRGVTGGLGCGPVPLERTDMTGERTFRDVSVTRRYAQPAKGGSLRRPLATSLGIAAPSVHLCSIEWLVQEANDQSRLAFLPICRRSRI